MKLELKGIRKHYGKVRANDGVDLTVQAGSIHAVLGENGAGKSTLMKIAAGYVRKTGGQVLLDDRPVVYDTPAHAVRLGIGMLYQDPLDFPNLSVLENYMIGQVRGAGLKADDHRLRLAESCSRLGFRLDPEAAVARLTIGERQQLEIIRLLALGTRILILDEPTTGISEVQKDILFQALRTLAREGNSVLLVSHKLEDTLALCDAVTVLRQGLTVGHCRAPLNPQLLLGMMFKEISARPVKPAVACGPAILEFEKVGGTGGRSGLDRCDVLIRQREIIGLAGLEGSGQSVFLRIAAGLQKADQGVVKVAERRIASGHYHAFRQSGIVFLPSARLEEGLIPGLSIAEHVTLRDDAGFFVDRQAAVSGAGRKIEDFRIAGTPQSLVESLSGGNQQRLLLSFLPSSPSLLLLENPTRGLDVDSALWIWRLLLLRYSRNAAIVFTSSELDEIMMVADRILVFFQGRIIKDVSTHETDIPDLGRAIAGKI